MKLLIAVLALVSSFAASAKIPKICPADTKEIFSCVSQSSIPLYPYIATCTTKDGSSVISMNSGAGRTNDILEVARTEEGNNIIFTATGEDTDSLLLTFSKVAVGPKKTNAVLTYSMGPMDLEDNFHCELAQ